MTHALVDQDAVGDNAYRAFVSLRDSLMEERRRVRDLESEIARLRSDLASSRLMSSCTGRPEVAWQSMLRALITHSRAISLLKSDRNECSSELVRAEARLRAALEAEETELNARYG